MENEGRIQGMDDAYLIAYVIIVFFFSGLVKGAVGVGLATISLGLMAVTLALPQAIALMLLPAFLTNFWQAFYGGYGLTLLKRLWPFYLIGNLTIFIGALALTRVDLDYLLILLGVLLIIYGVLNLTRFHFNIPPGRESSLGVLLGGINGIITGMTGSYVVPGVMYLQGIGLPRDQLIQAMGILFFTLTISLTAALGGNKIWSLELGGLSLFAVLPTLIGVYAGQSIRKNLSEALFRKLLLISLILLGIYIVFKALITGGLLGA